MNISSMSFDIDSTEYFYNLEKLYDTSPNIIKAHVPKLLPRITRGTPRYKKKPINRSIFVNASDCKVTPSNIITTQNYITLKHHPDDHPTFTSKVNENGYIDKYTKFTLEVMHHDIRKMYFVNK